MQLFFFIGLVFSPLAAACAFIITYGEYTHHYPTKKEPLKLAWEATIFTFIAFTTLILGAGFFVSNFVLVFNHQNSHREYSSRLAEK